ncbi:tyrosine-type recombinase/integrase [Sporolactobacillus sp. CPB3-1]|uniref:Tyrosine-type recombinase/integrase n=1 Tax=Sporolactobacillus mangiferae TaxID=2940498 RepID=A0ABT0MAH3_9BACL|nr:tyrosine-type recombinase/integrase [Sporolactobacillus mangiferae]MCL1631876.1 tyrosine-type recombinase/integrase [Sporolactobacillus mangiferae]
MKKTIDNFLDAMQHERDLSKNTVEAYQSDLLQYVRYLREIKQCTDWEDVTEVQLMNYLYQLKDSGCAPATLARKAAALRGFHRFLFRSHLTSSDPAYALSVPKAAHSHFPALLTTEQIYLLLRAPSPHTRIGKRDRALLEVLYATGMRASECIRLDHGHVNLSLEFIRCVGKKGTERILPLNISAITALREYITEWEQKNAAPDINQPLFTNRSGKRLTRQGLWKILRNHAESAALPVPISPETLRQSLTAHLLQNGAPLDFVDELMGRALVSSASRYMHLNRVPLKELYNRYHPLAKS